VFAVENNLFFDAEILIMMNRELAQAKDAQGNNLLHIAAKNRNEELFSFLLKRTGPAALAAKNNVQVTIFSWEGHRLIWPNCTERPASSNSAKTTRPTPEDSILPSKRVMIAFASYVLYGQIKHIFCGIASYNINEQ
jgi:ankyrin repeat protein